MLKVKDLKKSYADKLILDDISLEIEPGKLTTLLGENGAGKSTLLNLMSGYELPDLGEVTYKDESLYKLNFTYVHDIFFIHEKIDYKLDINMDEYISYLKEDIPNWDDEFFDEMVSTRKIDLANKFQNYSRGQKMQIVLMIGLASNPEILLLDEITSVIDVHGRKYFLDLLSKFVSSGKTVVITTNIISELEFYTDNLIVLKNQKIELDDSVENIPDQFIKVRQKVGDEHQVFNMEECVWSGVNSDRSVSYIIPKSIAENLEIPTDLYDRRKSNLEDVFIYYFSRNEDSK